MENKMTYKIENVTEKDVPNKFVSCTILDVAQFIYKLKVLFNDDSLIHNRYVTSLLDKYFVKIQLQHCKIKAFVVHMYDNDLYVSVGKRENKPW